LAARYLAMLLLALASLAGMFGCSSKTVIPPADTSASRPPPQGRAENPDQARLKDALVGPGLPAPEVVDLSDRLLADGNPARHDQETMARLELVLLKTIKGSDKAQSSGLWRNLGIIHYHQKKYSQARQELQAANELNPRVARTHFFLACLFAHQGAIFDKKGKKKVSRQQYKRASIEMDQARKLEPGNALYRQDIKQVIAQENGQ